MHGLKCFNKPSARCTIMSLTRLQKFNLRRTLLLFRRSTRDPFLPSGPAKRQANCCGRKFARRVSFGRATQFLVPKMGCVARPCRLWSRIVKVRPPVPSYRAQPTRPLRRRTRAGSFCTIGSRQRTNNNGLGRWTRRRIYSSALKRINKMAQDSLSPLPFTGACDQFELPPIAQACKIFNLEHTHMPNENKMVSVFVLSAQQQLGCDSFF